MGSSASKPARSAAGAVSRRQYPKKPTAPPTPSPAAAPPKAPKERKSKPQKTPQPPPPPTQFPQSQPRSQGPTYHSTEQPSSVKSNAIDMDGRDPDFAASLRHIGPVNPVPTFSNSSTFNQAPAPYGQTVFPTSTNPALLALSARKRIAKAAEQEAEDYTRGNFAGREFVDALTIRQALTMRERQGLSNAEIESTLRLKKGVLDRLGKAGVVSQVG